MMHRAWPVAGKIYEDRIRGPKAARPALAMAFEAARAGDVLTVWRLIPTTTARNAWIARLTSNGLERLVMLQQCMGRASREQRLTLAERHVAHGKRIIARQRKIIAILARAGHDTGEAERMLANFEAIHVHQVADRDRIGRHLEEHHHRSGRPTGGPGADAARGCPAWPRAEHTA